MAIENLDSAFISSLDVQPISMLTAGEGAPAEDRILTDTIAVTASGVTQIGSTYRLCRFPVYAKVKRLQVSLSGGDTNAAATLAYDVNVAFSDSLYDGTQQPLQSTIPTTALNGSVTTIAVYTAPNILFGSVKGANTTGLLLQADETFNGNVAGWRFNGVNLPLWDYFGFINAQGIAQDPSGFFDILFRVSTAAATPAAGLIAVSLDYGL